MNVEDQLRALAEKVQGMPTSGFTERETERYLVEPFLDALGYDSRNPSEVEAQFPIKIGSTTRICDYAVKVDDEVRVLVEAKKASVSLDSPGQLASYFSQAPTALLGIYTNGLEYRFYAEHNQGRVKQMDSAPFLVLDLRRLDQAAMTGASQCAKNQLADAEGFLRVVSDSRYSRLLEDRLRRELTGQPSDEFVSLAMDWAGIGEKTPELVERFRVMVSIVARNMLVPAKGDCEA